MRFEGFSAEDFELFSIPEFAGRMTAIRTRLRPKLAALGEALAGPAEAATGLPIFPHVAQHMRRRVNPPAETWVAFGRDRRGYKRWTHYRLAVGGEGVRLTVFVEDDAEDKPQLGATLRTCGGRVLAALGAEAPIRWYTLETDGAPPGGVTADRLAALGAALEQRKTLHFQAGVPLPAAEALRLSPEAFVAWAAAQFRTLAPLYLAGARPEALR